MVLISKVQDCTFFLIIKKWTKLTRWKNSKEINEKLNFLFLASLLINKNAIKLNTHNYAHSNCSLFREKYNTIPIPGGETTLDGAQLRAEATTEKENLVTQLRENLDEVSRKKIFENKAAEAQQQMEMLQKAPLAIYVG